MKDKASLLLIGAVVGALAATKIITVLQRRRRRALIEYQTEHMERMEEFRRNAVGRDNSFPYEEDEDMT